MRLLLTGLTLFITLVSWSQSTGFEKTSTRKDTCMILHGVLWDFNKWTIRPSSDGPLTELKFYLLAHPEVVIEIGVHSDSRGSNRYSTCLTCKRAESIRLWLTDQGIRDDRIVAKGYGESKPLVSDMEIARLNTQEKKEKAHQKNRRVEIRVLANELHPMPTR